MAEQKVIAVVGATGAQGGGLVRAIAADPHIGRESVNRQPAAGRERAHASSCSSSSSSSR